MGLLDKFFGDGNINDRYGKKVGNIEHIDNNHALIHDENYNVVGRIESYGDEVRVYDSSYNLQSVGNYYGDANRLEIEDLYGNIKSSMEEHNGIISETERYGVSPSYYYSSSDCCSDNFQSESDGLGPEFWDNIDDDDDW